MGKNTIPRENKTTSQHRAHKNKNFYNNKPDWLEVISLFTFISEPNCDMCEIKKSYRDIVTPPKARQNYYIIVESQSHC